MSTQHKGRYSSAWEGHGNFLTFYGEIKPVMIILRILGVLPYSVTATGDVCFKWLSVASFYSLLCISFMATLVGFTLAERFILRTKLEDSFEENTIEYAVRLFISSVFIIPTNHWPETGKKMKFINRWTELQAEYKITTGRHLCLGLQRKVSFSLVISLGLVTAFMGMVYLKGVILHWWQYIDFVFVISITVLLPFIWIFTCLALTKVAIELADDIEKHFSSRGFRKISKISSYMKLWLKLSKLTQDLGNATTLTYGGQTLLFFTISVLLVYGFIVKLAKGFNYILFTPALLFQVIIFSQCNSAHSASTEVGLKFSERLHAIISNLPAADTEEVREMRHFLAVIGKNPPIISFSGFVNVNRKLITSLISAMVTYLVVLMQFQLNKADPQQKSSSV